MLPQLQAAVKAPDRLADQFHRLGLLGRGRHQLLQVPFGMNPAQGMLGNPELAGIVGHNDGGLHQPVMPDRPPGGSFVQRLQ